MAELDGSAGFQAGICGLSHAEGFRVVGKIMQPLDTFSMPVQLRIETEGNPELKTVDVVGTESTFTVETFGRPKPGGIRIDPEQPGAERKLRFACACGHRTR